MSRPAPQEGPPGRAVLRIARDRTCSRQKAKTPAPMTIAPPAIVQGETIYTAAKRMAAEQGAAFTCAKMFWWFNQGAPVDWAVTPKPWYGSDGSKEFGIHGAPDDLPAALEKALGRERLERYETGLEALEERQRQAVVLRLEFGYSHAQIAEAIDAPSANAARMVVSRALSRLVEILDR